MRGSWERLVRSVKTCLRVVQEKYTKEQLFKTTLIGIGNILNNRPLTYISVDPDDPEALTPNHFF